MSVPYIHPSVLAHAMSDPEAMGETASDRLEHHMTNGAIRVAEQTASDMRRAMMFGEFLDHLFRPSPVVAAVASQAPRKLSKKDKLREAIARRDGDDCWLCGTPLGEDATIEHHVPRAHQGSGNISNLRLCHLLCNRALAHRTPEEKVALRVATRAAGLSAPVTTGSGACLTSGPVPETKGEGE